MMQVRICVALEPCVVRPFNNLKMLILNSRNSLKGKQRPFDYVSLIIFQKDKPLLIQRKTNMDYILQH